jgi:hypothetical protein
MVIHILLEGRVMCGFCWLGQDAWPPDNKWVGADETTDANCEECKAAHAAGKYAPWKFKRTNNMCFVVWHAPGSCETRVQLMTDAERATVDSEQMEIVAETRVNSLAEGQDLERTFICLMNDGVPQPEAKQSADLLEKIFELGMIVGNRIAVQGTWTLGQLDTPQQKAED